MRRTSQVIWVVGIVAVLGTMYLWWSSSQNSVPATPASFQNSPLPTSANGAAGTSVPRAVAVTFNGSGFSPQSVTVAQGGTVTFASTGALMWVASDPYPLQNGYDGTTEQQHCAQGYPGLAPFDQCSSGTSFSFTFDKVGTWGYHDYLEQSAAGTVTVVAQ